MAKTTINISDPLLREARKIAAREGATLGELVEQGLRKIVAERKRAPAFRLRKASVGGHGLRPELKDAGWGRMRELAYKRPEG